MIDDLKKEDLATPVRKLCNVDPTGITRRDCNNLLVQAFHSTLQRVLLEAQSKPIYQSPVSGIVDLSNDHLNMDRKRVLDHEYEEVRLNLFI